MQELATQVTQSVLDTLFRFAMTPQQWDNKSMTKLSIVAAAFLAIGLASAEAALAPQSSPPGPHQAPAATPPAKPTGAAQTSTPSKAATATGAKRPATPAAPLQTAKQKASYATGQNIAKGL